MIIEMIIKVIRSPKKAFEEEIGNLTFFLFMFLNGAILYLYSIAFVKFGLKSIEKSLPDIFSGVGNTLTGLVTAPKFLYLSLLIPFLTLLISSSLYDMLAQIIFKRSNGTKLMKNLAFASTPLMLLRLIYVVLSFFNVMIFSEISILFLIWEVVLFIIAISKTYDIETTKANFLFFTPYIIIILVLIPAII